MDNPFAPSDADVSPLPPSRATGLGALALALGLWSGCGSCLGVTNALSGPPPDELPPFLSASQGQAALEFARTAAAFGPIDGAVALATLLAGLMLMIAAILGFSRHARAGLGLRVAFLVSVAVDALQALWMVAWFALLWSDFTAYTRALMQGMPTAPGSDVNGIISVAIGLTVVLGVAYYALKIAVAGAGAWLARPTSPEAGSDAPLQGAGWAD